MRILESKAEGTGLLIENEGITNRIVEHGLVSEGVVNAVKDSNRMYVECILQKANTKNRNGRIYPRHLLDRELSNYIKLVEQRNSFGEICHPDRSEISLKRNDLGLLVTDFWWKGDTLWGVIEILTTEKYDTDGTIGCDADYIANLLKKKCKLGISSRGLGSVKRSGDVLMVQSDFELIGWDLVSSPSTPDAYLYKEIQNEGLVKMNEQKNIISTEKQMNDTELKMYNFLKNK